MSTSLEPAFPAFFLGSLLNYGLLGMLSIQVYFYILHFPKDRMVLKLTVSLIFLLDIVQTVFATLIAWALLNYVNSVGSSRNGVPSIPPWALCTLSPLAATVALPVQFFFAWRVWTLDSSAGRIAPVVGMILSTSLASFAMAIVFGITQDQSLISLISDKESNLVIGWLSTSLACDLFITVVLVIQLRSKVQQDFAWVNHVLHRATRMALETGALTCAAAAVQLFLYLKLDDEHFYFYLLLVISGKIYSNSLLASLNSRAPIFRGKQASDTEVWQASYRAQINFATSTLEGVGSRPGL